MRTALFTHPAFFEHVSPSFHPERPQRLDAVIGGARESGFVSDEITAEPIELDLLEQTHPRPYIEMIRSFCGQGGGHLDADTYAVEGSWEAALRAAGAGPQAVRLLEDGGADNAFLAVRPPGHHAVASQAMGFCLFNNVAVTAEYLVQAGFRVAVFDWDVHHGNGTQDLFVDREDVLYCSVHQYPFYPGSGWLDETGYGPGRGTVLNLPVPAGTGGDVYRAAVRELFVPVLERYEPDWILVSAGYDAHRQDPLADLRLDSADYGFMAAEVGTVVQQARTIYFLEGGYDLDAIRASVAATLAGAAGGDFSGQVDHRSPERAWQNLELVTDTARNLWKIG